MKQKTYSEKLRDPRWQKKRLEIMQRDNFTCRWCCDTKKTLNVHHLKYSGNPWEADTEYLITVCEECHQDDHNNRDAAENELLTALKLKGYSYDHIGWLIYAIKSAICDDPWLITQIIAAHIINEEKFKHDVNEMFGG